MLEAQLLREGDGGMDVNIPGLLIDVAKSFTPKLGAQARSSALTMAPSAAWGLRVFSDRAAVEVGLCTVFVPVPLPTEEKKHISTSL